MMTNKWDPWLAETQISTALSTAAILHCRYPVAPWLSQVIADMDAAYAAMDADQVKRLCDLFRRATARYVDAPPYVHEIYAKLGRRVTRFEERDLVVQDSTTIETEGL